jgi:hypothetical protein
MGDLISHRRDLSRHAHPCKRRYDWLAKGQNEAGEGFAEFEDGVGHGKEPVNPHSEVVGGVHWNFEFPNHCAINPEKNLNRQVAKGAKEDLCRLRSGRGIHGNFNHGSDFAKATTDRSHGLSRMKRIGNLKSQISNFKKEARSSS